MQLPLTASTFVTVSIAELGDKTQLASVALSSTTHVPLAVFIGSSSALVLASLLGTAVGGSLAAMLPGKWLQLAAAIGFLIIGGNLLLNPAENQPPPLPTVDS